MTPQSDVRTILIQRGNQPPSASVVGDRVIVLELEISWAGRKYVLDQNEDIWKGQCITEMSANYGQTYVS